MRQFSQPVSMPCTEQQYKADLRQPLKEMGYKVQNEPWRKNIILIGEKQTWSDNYITTRKKIGYWTVISIHRNSEGEKSWEYNIPTYNPKLFLAIAAMCSDDPTKTFPGRYFKCIKAFKSNEGFHKLGELRNEFEANTGSVVATYWIPATLEDLVEAFGHVPEGKLPSLLPKKPNYKEALYKVVDLITEVVDVLHKNLNPETYDNEKHHIQITMDKGNWKAFDLGKVTRNPYESIQAYGSRVHEAAEAMLPKKVDNPLPGKNYLFNFIHDELHEGEYVCPFGQGGFSMKVGDKIYPADVVYEMPAKKEYTEEDMRIAWESGYGRAVLGDRYGAASKQNFKNFMKGNYGKTT